MPKISKTKWLLLIIVAAISIILNINIVKAAKSDETDPPSWISWQEKKIKSDSGVSFVLSKKRLVMKDGSNHDMWESSKDYLVQDVLVSDIDRNGDEEVILLLWKIGRYGRKKPFWITSDEEEYSQHIFIYDIKDKDLQEKWCASDIGRLVTRIKLMKKDNAILLQEDTDGNCTLWVWESFGLKNIDNQVKFIAFGDNIIHKNIYEYADAKEGGTYNFLYEPFKKEIESADIAAIAAETILVDKKKAVSDYPSFGSPIAVGKAIKDAGFDIAVCGNNHALDKGIYGIDVTTDFYNENGIICLGIQNSKDKEYRPYEIISKNGIRFALFSYTYGTNDIDVSLKYPYAVHYLPGTENEKKKVMEDIKKAKKEADFVVVFVHWGDEYKKKISDKQKKMAQLFSDANADVVIGTHPHVVQDTEMINRQNGESTLVYYSLGNFRADQGRSADTRIGAEAIFFVEHTYDGIKLRSHEIKEVSSYWRD